MECLPSIYEALGFVPSMATSTTQKIVTRREVRGTNQEGWRETGIHRCRRARPQGLRHTQRKTQPGMRYRWYVEGRAHRTAGTNLWARGTILDEAIT